MAQTLAERWTALEQRLRMAEAAARWADVEARLERLEHTAVSAGSSQPHAATQPELPADASPTHARLHAELVKLGFNTWRFVRVPADYYDQPLEYRQVALHMNNART
jgi:hypothetical protein